MTFLGGHLQICTTVAEKSVTLTANLVGCLVGCIVEEKMVVYTATQLPKF
jgi:hypothetical protein